MLSVNILAMHYTFRNANKKLKFRLVFYFFKYLYYHVFIFHVIPLLSQLL